MMVIAVDSGYFYAGIVVRQNVIIHSAPILKWAKGMWIWNFEKYTAKKGWKLIYCLEDLIDDSSKGNMEQG